MTDSTVMDREIEETPLSVTDRAELTRMLDTFLATGATRNIVPMSEVQDLALDLRLILNPVLSSSDDQSEMQQV